MCVCLLDIIFGGFSHVYSGTFLHTLDSLSMNSVKVGDVIEFFSRVIIVGNIFINNLSKFFQRKELCSFFISVAFVKSRLWPILFLCITKKFKWLPKRKSLLCS